MMISFFEEEDDDVSLLNTSLAWDVGTVAPGIGSPVRVSRFCGVSDVSGVLMEEEEEEVCFMEGDDFNEGVNSVGIASIGGDNFIGADEVCKDDALGGTIGIFVDDETGVFLISS